MLAMALTAQASPILLTSDAAAVAGVAGILWLGAFVIGIVWLIFPFVVWAKLNRIVQNTRKASENLHGLYSVARQSCTAEQLVKIVAQQEFEKP